MTRTMTSVDAKEHVVEMSVVVQLWVGALGRMMGARVPPAWFPLLVCTVLCSCATDSPDGTVQLCPVHHKPMTRTEVTVAVQICDHDEDYSKRYAAARGRVFPHSCDDISLKGSSIDRLMRKARSQSRWIYVCATCDEEKGRWLEEHGRPSATDLVAEAQQTLGFGLAVTNVADVTLLLDQQLRMHTGAVPKALLVDPVVVRFIQMDGPRGFLLIFREDPGKRIARYLDAWFEGTERITTERGGPRDFHFPLSRANVRYQPFSQGVYILFVHGRS